MPSLRAGVATAEAVAVGVAVVVAETVAEAVAESVAVVVGVEDGAAISGMLLGGLAEGRASCPTLGGGASGPQAWETVKAVARERMRATFIVGAAVALLAQL
jgi:alkanesulfonate monooxygenase SsuD/methylene tetrahydromethanopterin reductase-like flavin-dependent oxidoreductase (luciferase family)